MISSLLSKILIINEKTGRSSYVLTAFIFGIFIVNLKLLLSGISLYHLKMELFSGTDYAAAIVALTSLYVSNKHINNLANNSSKEDNKDVV